MGVLRVEKYLDEQLIGSMFHYLSEQREASYKVVCEDSKVITYWVEGDDIPKGHKIFTIGVTELVPGVLMFQIQVK